MDDLTDLESDAPLTCPVCGAELEWHDCWHCLGEGGFHDCGEDCCPCLHPDLDLNQPCPECKGETGYLECPCLPHSDTQLNYYRLQMENQNGPQESR